MNSPRIRSMAVSFAAASAFLIGSIVLSAYYLSEYGLVLFLVLPFVYAFIYTALRTRTEVLPFRRVFGEIAVATLLSSSFVILFAIEGLICILMSLPLALPLLLLGTFCGALVSARQARMVIGALVLGAYLLLGLESRLERPPVTRTVESSVLIQADQDVVWEKLVAFGEIEATPRFPLVLGVAYPVSAWIEGEGVGAVRNCNFNTGTFVEPIHVWEPGERLAFTVREQPPALKELSLWDIHPPHLDGFFRSIAGEFRLTRVDADTVRLVGTSHYELRLYPSAYWTIPVDYIVAAIHRRVLEHIKREAERPFVAGN